MNSTEFVINAELMLYTNKSPFSGKTSYFVEVTAIPAATVPTEIPGAGERLRYMEEVHLDESGYVVIPVAEMTRTLIALGK